MATPQSVVLQQQSWKSWEITKVTKWVAVGPFGLNIGQNSSQWPDKQFKIDLGNQKIALLALFAWAPGGYGHGDQSNGSRAECLHHGSAAQEEAKQGAVGLR